jgi:hypothetical protein
MTTGTILAIRDCGPLILVFVDAGDGCTVPLVLERRSWTAFLREHGCISTELVGRCITFEDGSILFLN